MSMEKVIKRENTSPLSPLVSYLESQGGYKQIKSADYRWYLTDKYALGVRSEGSTFPESSSSDLLFLKKVLASYDAYKVSNGDDSAVPDLYVSYTVPPITALKGLMSPLAHLGQIPYYVLESGPSGAMLNGEALMHFVEGTSLSSLFLHRCRTTAGVGVIDYVLGFGREGATDCVLVLPTVRCLHDVKQGDIFWLKCCLAG